MSDEKKKHEVQLEIHLDENTAQGVFANLAVVNHSDAEITLDFIYVQPQMPKGKVRSRVILSPANAKRFLAALQENLASFEQKFGTVNLAPPVIPQPDGSNYH